jgi:hypothetical protein
MKTSPSALADAAARQELLYRRCALPCLLLALACLLAGLLLSGWSARLLCLSLSASLWLLTGALYGSSNLAGWRRKRQALPALPLFPLLLPGKSSPPTIQRAPTYSGQIQPAPLAAVATPAPPDWPPHRLGGAQQASASLLTLPSACWYCKPHQKATPTRMAC